MHVLSTLSVIVFGLSIVYKNNDVYKLEKGVFRTAAILIGGSISWIALTNSQFYIATSKEAAWFWHRLSSAGWITIIPATSMYMLYMAGEGAFFSKLRNRIMFYILPVVLIVHTLFGKGTPGAQDVVLSRIGWGWTYVNYGTTIWLWIYLITLFSYMGTAMFFVGKNVSKDEYRNNSKLAKFFNIFDAVIITLSLLTDIILPIFTDYFVPLGAILNIMPIITFAYMSKMHDTLHFERIISSEVLFETSASAFLVFDETGKIFFSNEKASEIFKKSSKELKGAYYFSLVDKDDYYYESMEEFKENKCFYNKIGHFQHKGVKRSIMVSASEAFDKKKNFLGYVASCQDVTKIISVNELLEKQNNTDELTGLLNRRCFFKTSKKYIKEYNEKNINFAAISIDIDQFKLINEKYGHGFGDLVLVQVSKLLKSVLKKEELLFRVSGDEFVILINEMNLIERINELEEEIEKFVNLSLTIQDVTFNIGLSYGSELYSEGRNFEDIVKNADHKMNINKQSKSISLK